VVKETDLASLLFNPAALRRFFTSVVLPEPEGPEITNIIPVFDNAI